MTAAPMTTAKDRLYEACHVGRCGPLSRALSRALITAAPVREVDTAARFLLGRPRHPQAPFTVTRDGVQFELDLRDVMSRLIYLDTFETELRRALLPLLSTGLFVDVGANCGYWSRNAVARGMSAIAYEPLPQTVEKLRRNVALNGFDSRLAIRAAAVGDRRGEATLFVPDPDRHSDVASLHATATGAGVQVEVVTLDEDLADVQDEIEFLKIDVEGHEMAVLDGAAETFSRLRPRRVLIETIDALLASAGTRSAEIVETMRARGYEPTRWFRARSGLWPHPAPQTLPRVLPPDMHGNVMFSRTD